MPCKTVIVFSTHIYWEIYSHLSRPLCPRRGM